MTFTYYGADLSTTIKNYSKDGYSYHIEYLDGNSYGYDCYDEHESERLDRLMIEQALDRQGVLLNDNGLRIKKGLSITGIVISTCALTFFSNNSQIVLAAMALTGTFYAMMETRKSNVRLKELKKYKMFLDMHEDLYRVNESDLLTEIEPDRIYQTSLEINNIDKYSYSDMKVIYKKFNKTLYS